ncbi:MAG: GNAT family N-acetyltransferase [Methylotenera sp.]|nr:GNAT family N-acetyltransferase [Oligoflexia bacterium]
MADYGIRPLRKEDNVAVAALIRKVMPEFGCGGVGFASQDAEVDDMHASYLQPRSAYFVITNLQTSEKILGGGGIAPLAEGDGLTCELRKMYFYPELRGQGMGQKLMDRCLETAHREGFRFCYLETMHAMVQARALYVRNGFEPLTGPRGATGHFGCDSWFLKSL